MNVRHTRLYEIWHNMRRRCNDPRRDTYSYYGGRGIKVCEEWNEFKIFKEWADLNGYSPYLTLERNDNDGNYTPDNCCWKSRREQSNNRYNTKMLTAFGETKPFTHWLEDIRCKAHRTTLRSRIRLGWSHEKAISQPSLIPRK